MHRLILLLILLLPARSLVGQHATPQGSSLSIERVSKITVRGESGTMQSVEWSSTLGGGATWQVLTNVTLGTEGTVVVDVAVGSSMRFYRASASGLSTSGNSFVTVGDPGNEADSATGFGAVGYTFQIQKFEFTNAEYVDFLNAVGGTNPNGIYSKWMGSDSRGGIRQSGVSPNFTYAVKRNMRDKPVNYVRWCDAARVANWLHNGRSTNPALLETGAYTLNNATSGVEFTKNAGARYWVPSEDEWYKAAYYKGGGLSAGYWLYPTKSSTLPTTVTASLTGVGSAGYESTANSINGAHSADWNGSDGNVTTVGSNGGPSTYGAYDMGGNVWEWNDGVMLGKVRVIRGGSWFNNAFETRSKFSSTKYTALSDYHLGFRLARSSVP